MKKLILFTEDSNLSNMVVDAFPEGRVELHLFDKPVNDMNFTDAVVIMDYDCDNTDPAKFLSELVAVSGPETKILVLSMDCERRNVADVAKRGASRFIVKPLNKTRIKKYIMPYMNIDVTQTVSDL